MYNLKDKSFYKDYVVVAYFHDANGAVEHEKRVTDVTSNDKSALVRLLNGGFRHVEPNVWEDGFGQCFTIWESKWLFEGRGDVMINFTKLYKMDLTELSDIIFTLELCRMDALKLAADIEEIYDAAQAPEELRKKNSGLTRARDLEKLITYLGGKQYVRD